MIRSKKRLAQGLRGPSSYAYGFASKLFCGYADGSGSHLGGLCSAPHTPHTLAKVHRSHQSAVFLCRPRQPLTPAGLFDGVALLCNVLMLTQTAMDSRFVHYFTVSCQTDFISCQANLVSVFARVTNLKAF